MLISHSVLYFNQPGKTPQVKAELSKSCYIRLAKANYMKLMTLGSYLRNYIIVVVKSAMLCTAVISCTIFRGQWVEWGSPTLWPLHCLSELLQRKRVEHGKSSKTLGKADEYWQLRSRLSASYNDLKHIKIFWVIFFLTSNCAWADKKKLKLLIEEYLFKNTGF